VKEDITSQPTVGTATWRNEQTSIASRKSRETRSRLMGPFEKTLWLKGGWDRAVVTQETGERRRASGLQYVPWLLEDVEHCRVPRGSQFKGTGFMMLKVC
jgi:hypothetical protein